jgi:hypothetical protein
MKPFCYHCPIIHPQYCLINISDTELTLFILLLVKYIKQTEFLKFHAECWKNYISTEIFQKVPSIIFYVKHLLYHYFVLFIPKRSKSL